MSLKESQTDKLWGIICCVLGVVLFFLIIPAQIKEIADSPWYNSPRFFPNLLSGILFICGIALFVIGTRKQKSENDPDCCTFHIKELKIVLLTLVIMAAYTLAMSYLVFHYIVVTAVTMAALMILCSERNWKLIVVVSIILPTIVYFSFKYGLYIRFP